MKNAQLIMRIANLYGGNIPPELKIDRGSGEYHPRKHTVQSYAAQNRAARKRRQKPNQ